MLAKHSAKNVEKPYFIVLAAIGCTVKNRLKKYANCSVGLQNFFSIYLYILILQRVCESVCVLSHTDDADRIATAD